jgi:hypothetical protein
MAGRCPVRHLGLANTLGGHHGLASGQSAPHDVEDSDQFGVVVHVETDYAKA